MQAEALPIAQVILDLLPQPGVIDHYVGEARRTQRQQMVFDQRYTARTHQRFGRVQGQGAHALTLTGSENHRFHASLFKTIDPLLE
jgi:ABC-type multidrug transport system ATPase subunit